MLSSIPLLDQDRRQSLGTLPTPPSLTSQEVFDLQVLSFMDRNSQKGPPAVSGPAPRQLASVHQHLLQSGVNCLQGWRSHNSLGSLAPAELFDHPLWPLLSNHLEPRWNLYQTNIREAGREGTAPTQVVLWALLTCGSLWTARSPQKVVLEVAHSECTETGT